MALPLLSYAQINFNNQQHELKLGKMTSFPELYVQFQIIEKSEYTHFQLSIHPKEKVNIQGLHLRFEQSYRGASIFCNGFQSESESKLYSSNEKIVNLKAFVKPYYGYKGDYHIDEIKRKAGHLHSWTYSYVQTKNKIDFVGSLNEHTALTLIKHQINEQQLIVESDCDNLELEHSFPVLDFIIAQGNPSVVFNRYFGLIGIPNSTAKHLRVWSTFGLDWNNIDQDSFLKKTHEIKSSPFNVDALLFDNGHQNSVGDWEKTRINSPSRFPSLLSAIKKEGLQTGIWLAPFVCEKKSKLFINKKNWLLKNKKGKPQRVSSMPNTGTVLYALDFYNPEVQDYLSKVFYLYSNEWAFDFFHLDYLYAVCLNAPKHKTRGQVMYDAMNFLRTAIGNKKLMALKIPIGSSFGFADYFSVCPPFSYKWMHKSHRWLGLRERNSALNALKTTLGRWNLNGKAFKLITPHFILTNAKNNFSEVQQYTISLISILLGNITISPDSIEQYSPEQWTEFHSLQAFANPTIKSLDVIGQDVYRIGFVKEGLSFKAYINLNETEAQVSSKNLVLKLEAFESIVLKA